MPVIEKGRNPEKGGNSNTPTQLSEELKEGSKSLVTGKAFVELVVSTTTSPTPAVHGGTKSDVSVMVCAVTSAEKERIKHPDLNLALLATGTSFLRIGIRIQDATCRELGIGQSDENVARGRGA